MFIFCKCALRTSYGKSSAIGIEVGLQAESRDKGNQIPLCAIPISFQTFTSSLAFDQIDLSMRFPYLKALLSIWYKNGRLIF